MAIIPDPFQNSIIVQILKKATLDPNILTNYRPIAISSIHPNLGNTVSCLKTLPVKINLVSEKIVGLLVQYPS